MDACSSCSGVYAGGASGAVAAAAARGAEAARAPPARPHAQRRRGAAWRGGAAAAGAAGACSASSGAMLRGVCASSGLPRKGGEGLLHTSHRRAPLAPRPRTPRRDALKKRAGTTPRAPALGSRVRRRVRRRARGARIGPAPPLLQPAARAVPTHTGAEPTPSCAAPRAASASGGAPRWMCPSPWACAPWTRRCAGGRGAARAQAHNTVARVVVPSCSCAAGTSQPRAPRRAAAAHAARAAAFTRRSSAGRGRAARSATVCRAQHAASLHSRQNLTRSNTCAHRPPSSAPPPPPARRRAARRCRPS
jgi:hypothetical protein